MYNLTNISVTNFMSFSEIDLSLENKCYVVRGINKDNKGQQSNGSGKTSLLEVIAVAFLGQSLTDRDLKSCVNRNTEDNKFTVTLTLSNHKDVVVIKRVVYSNTKSQELSITINGESIKDVPSKNGVQNGVDLRQGNQWIFDTLLGISKDDLLNYFLISDKYYKSFLSSGNADKIAVISRFSNATLVDKAIAKLEKEKGKVEDDMLSLDSDISNLQGQIEGLQYTISPEAKAAFEQEKVGRLNALLPRKQRLKEQLEQLDIKSTELVKKQLECEGVHSRLNPKQQVELANKKKEIQTLSREINSLISQVTNKLAGTITCPNCEHQFILSNEPIDELKQTLESSQQDLEVIEAGIKEVDDEIEGAKLLKQIDDEFDRLSKQQDDTESSWLALLEQIESIEKQQFESQDIANKLAELQLSIDENQKEISKQSKQIDQHNTWIDRFERFKYFLINKPISIICSRTNDVLKQIGSEYSITIDGFRKLKSGELRAELTPMVHINGVSDIAYTSFSAGERTRLDLACDLAIQQMINSTSNGGLNMYINDEKISGLDPLGIQLVANSFDKLNKTILLVSHSGSEITYQNVITVEKKNKQSILV